MRMNGELAQSIREAFGPQSNIGKLPLEFIKDEWTSHVIGDVGVDPMEDEFSQEVVDEFLLTLFKQEGHLRDQLWLSRLSPGERHAAARSGRNPIPVTSQEDIEILRGALDRLKAMGHLLRVEADQVLELYERP